VSPLIGYPKSWTPGTPGTITADVIYAPIQSEADFEKHRGKLRGKIVLIQPAREVKMLEGRLILRMNEADLKEAETTPVPAPRPARRAGGAAAAEAGDDQPAGRQRAMGLQRKIQEFLLSEGVAAVFDRGADSYLAAGGS